MLRKIDDPEKEVLYESVMLVYDAPGWQKGYGPADLRTCCRHYCRHYVIDEYSLPQDEPETLAQVETWLVKHHGEAKGCMVITEYGLSGRIFRYGNHGDFWEEVGETCGYA